MTESAKKARKKELDRTRHLSRISIGTEMDRWMEFKREHGLASHTEVARVLFNR